MTRRHNLTTRCLALLAVHAASWLALLMLVRMAFVAVHIPMAVLGRGSEYLPGVACNALRFDLQATAYAALLPVAMLLAVMAVRRESVARVMATVTRWWSATVAAAIVLLGCIDHGFYRNFGSHINSTFFDFFDEGPWSLTVAIWNEYPVVQMALLVVAVFALWARIGGRLARRMAPWRGHKPTARHSIATLLCMAPAIVLLMRGSAGPYPLQAEDLIVSPVAQINDIIPNAMYMLKKAASDRSKSVGPWDAETALAIYGFGHIDEAGQAFADGLGLPAPEPCGTDTLAWLDSLLMAEAPAADSVPPPDVVLLLSESWSMYLGTLHNESCPLMPGMWHHWQEDMVFDRFTSVRNGTARSLECMVAGVPFPGFFLSAYHYTPMPTSIAHAFAGSGYSTAFVTGMDPGWGNLHEALAVQGFDTVVAQFEMQAAHPEYKACAIGVYDHHMMQSLLEMLAAPHDRPRFIMGLTTTNHPPLQLPDDIVLPSLPDSIMASPHLVGGREVVGSYLRGFQYANMALGQFLTRFKASAAAGNTIVVITGDHNVRSIIDYNTVDATMRHAVPLYIYLPPRLRESTQADTGRRGCHYDILPTLARLALRDTRYLRIGRDLLTADSCAVECSYNEEGLLCEARVQERATRFASAREALLHIYCGLVLRQHRHTTSQHSNTTKT